MAGRPLKQGLDYFSLDVDFFRSAKVKKIIKAFGAKSVSVLICLLTNIYRKDGYFMRWDGDVGCMIADEAGLCIGPSRTTELMVTDVLSKALSVGFFDAGIFDKYGVLTSEGIQERYFAACERRKKIEIIKEFFLLSPSDVSKNAVWKSATTMPFFKKNGDFGINADNNLINASNNSINVGINAQSKVKESKVKESKVVVVGSNSLIDTGGDGMQKTSAAAIPKSVLDAYEQNIRPVCSLMETEKLADDTERYGEFAVTKAIERAAIRGKRSIGYIEGILRRWESDGYDEAWEEDRRNGKTDERSRDTGRDAGRTATEDRTEEIDWAQFDNTAADIPGINGNPGASGEPAGR